MNNIPYVDQPCERCGSKKRISRTWKENIPTMTGKKTLVEYAQIICTNPVCQLAFDENLEKEVEKRKLLKLQKDDRDKLRRLNSLNQANKSRKNISRI